MSALVRFPAVFLAAFVACAFAQSEGKPGSVDRGKYIVEVLARCHFCHTPRDESGNPDRGRWLMGGPLQLRAAYPTHWATVAPRIAGQPPGTDAEVIRLLTTGLWKTGSPPTPPMPPFQMTREDAESVLAYLKSLPARE